MATSPTSTLPPPTPLEDDVASRFAGLRQDDVIIGVVGVTGAGKSTFIQKCCDGAIDIVGHDLTSFTQECKSYQFQFDDKTIVQLIDTPGFDDTTRSDDQVLKDLAAWLSFAFKGGFKLSGMIYLQTIGEPRMRGSHMTNLRMFREMTGLENMGSVVLTTTMWDKTERELGKKRELELMKKEDFWKKLINNGGRVKRFLNDRDSALDIIGMLVEQHRKFVPALQREMNLEGKDLDQTNAGKEVNAKIIVEKEKHVQEKKEMEKEMERALRDSDMKYTQEILDAQEINTRQLKQLERAQRELKISNERLLKEKEEQIERAKQEMQKLQENVDRQGKEHAVEIKKSKTREQEILADMQQQAVNFKRYKKEIMEDTTQFMLKIDQVYKNLAERKSVEREEERLAQLEQRAKGNPPPYSAVNQPQQNFQPMPPHPVYQPPPPVIYQQASTNDAMSTGAAMSVGGTMLGIAALGTTLCVLM